MRRGHRRKAGPRRKDAAKWPETASRSPGARRPAGGAQDGPKLWTRLPATRYQPIVENPPLARALYGGVELDRKIPPEHYKAVAEIIGYVFRLQGKLRPR